MRTLYFVLITCVFWCLTLSQALGGDLGYFQRHGDRFTVTDQKSIWSVDGRTVRVYLLACDYTERMLEDWTVLDGYMRCPPEETSEYKGHAGAKLTFFLTESGALKHLKFELSGVGNDAEFGFTQVKRSWRENFPVTNLSVSVDHELLFNGVFDDKSKDLIGVIHR